MPKIVCIVQARMGSSRLPGKVLKVLAGEPILSHLIKRLQKCRTIDQIVIATTTEEKDDPIIQSAEKLNIAWFRGSENDVLDRYLGAAITYGAEVVVRITSDCPLIDPITVDNVVEYYLSSNYDYASAGVSTGFPRGLDTEVFSLNALSRAHQESIDQSSREHVTFYMYHHPEKFKLGYYHASPELKHPEWRLCVDEENDYCLINEIYRRLYQKGSIIDFCEVVNLLKNKPELTTINNDVKQKTF